jgi:hypothetical protein
MSARADFARGGDAMVAGSATLAAHHIEIDDDSGEPLDVRVTITMSASLAKQIDEYRWASRRKSESATIRALVEAGLRAEQWRKRPT